MRDRRETRPVELEQLDVGLAADDEARPVEQVGPVATQLIEEHPLLRGRILLLRVFAVQPGEVEQQHEDAGPLDVAEKAVTEPPTLRRAFDEPGDVGQHELAPV